MNGQNKPIENPATIYPYKPSLRSAGRADKIAIADYLPPKTNVCGNCPLQIIKKNRPAKCQRSIVIDTKLTGQFTIRFTAKHLSKAWRATVVFVYKAHYLNFTLH